MASPTSNPRLPFKAACFDLDGTLLDTETLHMQAERRALSMLGVDRLVGDHPRTFGAGIEPGMRMLAETYELGDAQNLLDAYMPLWTHLVATELRPMPGARAAVDELAFRQVPMALVTSSDRKYVARTVGKLGLLKAFRCVITGDMVERPKPSPEPYLTAPGAALAVPSVSIRKMRPCRPSTSTPEAVDSRNLQSCRWPRRFERQQPHMNSRERYTRAITCEGPDRVPLMHSHLPGAVNVHGQKLADLYAKYPGDVLDSPIVIGQTGRSGQGGNFAFHDKPRGLGTIGETTFDEWGTGWYWSTSDNMGQATVHPLEDWAAFDSYRLPDPMIGIEGVAFVEDAVRRDDHQRFVFVDAGELAQRIWFLRGYENSLIDMIDEPPELYALVDKIVDWNITRIRRWHETGVVDAFQHRDDWGTQTALMIDPASWRKIFKPAYKRIADAIHEGGAFAAFHTDGYTWDIIPDLIEIGWDEINPQVHLMDIEELGRLYGGKICFRADIDRQHTLPYGTPDDVRKLVTRCFNAFGHFNGGYVGTGQAHSDVPLENVEAVLETVYGLRYDSAPQS